jgi:hypothetical protein
MRRSVVVLMSKAAGGYPLVVPSVPGCSVEGDAVEGAVGVVAVEFAAVIGMVTDHPDGTHRS